MKNNSSEPIKETLVLLLVIYIYTKLMIFYYRKVNFYFTLAVAYILYWSIVAMNDLGNITTVGIKTEWFHVIMMNIVVTFPFILGLLSNNTIKKDHKDNNEEIHRGSILKYDKHREDDTKNHRNIG